MVKTKTWYMVPVRGGSKGVPRKNSRILGSKPLMCHVLDTIKQIDPPEQIIVLTDDDELEAIANSAGVRVCKVKQQNGKETLDNKALEVIPFLEKHGAKPKDIFLTVQATCPFVTVNTIKAAKKTLEKKGSVITVIDDRHLGWRLDKNGEPIPDYKKRVNRQELPPQYRESGAVIGARISDIQRYKTRIIEPIGILPVSKEEGLDIDDFADWAVAEYLALNKKIFIRADAGPKLGMGHVYRSLAIGQELSKYQPVFFTSTASGSNLGKEFFAQHPFDFHGVKDNADFLKIAKKEKPDLIILDQLDTDSSYVHNLKKTGAKVVTFEDLGEGAKEADLLISDLYENPAVTREKQLAGVRFVILSPNFEYVPPVKEISKNVENILILFGGADPANLAVKSLEALQKVGFEGHVTVVQGLARKDRRIELKNYGLKGEILTNITYMPEVMRRADLAFSSAGRTITELMKLGIPTLCMCQNEKELTHTHATQACGVLNLGLGELVDMRTLTNNITFLLEKVSFRKQMNQRARHALQGHSNKMVMKTILEKLDMDF